MAEDPTKNTDPDDVVDAEIALDDPSTDGSGDTSDDEAEEIPSVEPADSTDDATEDEASADAEPAPSKAKDAEPTAPKPVVRRKVVSKRVTPKGGGPARSSGPATRASIAAAQERARKKGHGEDDLLVDHEEPAPLPRAQMNLPSPTWVPVLMFALLIVGALVIILNYMGVFGDPSNVRLIIGLVFILGGIITATQYR